MKQNDTEDIIELTEVVEEPGGKSEEPDEEAIRKAFEEDDFFSKIEEVDELSDAGGDAEEEEDDLPDDDESLEELLEGDDEDQEPDTDFDQSLLEEPSEDVVDLESVTVPEPGDSETDETRLAAELDTSFELAGSVEESSGEGLETEEIKEEDLEDEFGELEDFKIDVSIPASDSEDEAPSDETQPAALSGSSPLSGDNAEGQTAGQISSRELAGTVTPEKVEAVLERVAREVLGEAAERIFSKVAEEVLKEEIERIRAEISRLSNRE